MYDSRGMAHGWEVEVPGKTVVRLGEWTGEGLERAEVHWPGKGGKAASENYGNTLYCFPPNLNRKRR